MNTNSKEKLRKIVAKRKMAKVRQVAAIVPDGCINVAMFLPEDAKVIKVEADGSVLIFA